ncbi:MAG: virulence protein RhuM/Fic/DOC family protein [Chitinivibrionia bacterium]|nr:virulence protein RhuM/Fic/DOC family protein [Chitinivibrionia bacterium]
MTEKQEIVIYQGESGDISLSADFRNDTIWATQAQIAELFGTKRQAITKHLKNIFNEGELDEKVVSSKMEHTTQHGAMPNKTQTVQTKIYNLDAVLSVGYRVNSRNATIFRKWANKVLKDYLLKGVATNDKRLEQLNKALQIISRSDIPEVCGVAKILQDFSHGLDLLDQYDHQCLQKPKSETNGNWQLKYDEAKNFVNSMKFGKESSLFGNEKDQSFKATLGAIYQTFNGRELYPSIQEKAANLLYFVVKNHSFTDGNKRIAAALFVYFLDKNNALKDKNNNLLIDNNTLAAMTLMLALSKPEEKEIMCNLVMNFLNSSV